LILKRGVFKLLMTIGMVILTGMKKFFLSQAQRFDQVFFFLVFYGVAKIQP